jgi:hypothetical protein
VSVTVVVAIPADDSAGVGERAAAIDPELPAGQRKRSRITPRG